MSNKTEDEDYIEQWRRLLAMRRALTPLERFLIVIVVSTFVTVVGCLLLCLTYRRAALVRRYYKKKKLSREQQCVVHTISHSGIIITPPPSYDSIVQSARSPYLNDARKYSIGAMSDSGTTVANVGADQLLALESKNGRSQSVRSSFSHTGVLSTISNTYPSQPYARLQVELQFDLPNNRLRVHLHPAEHCPAHPAFGDQAEYFVRVQLSNSKLLKKFQDGWKHNRSNVLLAAWNKQPEERTKSLQRTDGDRLPCDERVQLQFEKNDLALTSLRLLLCCVDRSGAQDVMFESSIPMSTSLVPQHQQLVEFQSVPQVTFGEIFLGLSYLPTAQRFTISLHKMRYCCKTDKENRTDVRLTVGLFYSGRRFFQKKLPLTLNSPNVDNEIKDTIIQNIPQSDIQSVYAHLELSSKKTSSIPATSLLLGDQTRYRSSWQKMLEFPRQTHLGWYQFLG